MSAERRPRLDSLTGLRFIAAFAVFGRHLWQGFEGQPFRSMERFVVQGGAGVSFFFILSGFVMCWSRPTHDTVRRFYQRRLARIVPNHVVTWFAAVLLTLLVGDSIGPRQAVATLLLLQAWVPQHTVYFALNGVAWSLSCEIFFYAAFPFILPRLTRLSVQARRRLLFVLGAVVFVIALAFRHGQDDSVAYWFAYIFPPVRLIEFVIGMLVALEVRAGTWPKVTLPVASAVAVAAYATDAFVSPAWRWVALTLIPFTLLVGAAAQHDLAGRPSVLRSRVLVRLGIWSYAFYLCHWMVIKYAQWATGWRNHEFGWASGTLFALAITGVSIAVAAALFARVERPLERRLRPGPVPAALAP
jgi:peptidoglycan/LPS O-acetylase OafA/YrhL